MKSMTGFGRAKKHCANYDISIDISSVNKKGMELSVSMPREWAPMERLMAQTLKKTVTRGKISVSVRAENRQEGTDIPLDDPRLHEIFNRLKQTCSAFEVKFEPTADLVIKIAEMLSVGNSSADWEELWKEIEPSFEEAAMRLDDMRRTEGETLKSDLKMRLQAVYEMVCAVEKASRDAPQKYREQLLQRLANAGLELDTNDDRVLKEICIFADRCDICEETTRLKSHIGQFLSAMEETDPVGRKMDFICQEMGREINTIASKANSLEVTKIAIDLKNELERIREQTQNIE